MRTLIQALVVYPKLTGFAMGLLTRLISKRVWEDAILWKGFIRCCEKTQPTSFPVLLQLPKTQLEDVLLQSPGLKMALKAHSREIASRGAFPRKVLQDLGLF